MMKPLDIKIAWQGQSDCGSCQQFFLRINNLWKRGLATMGR